MPNDSRIQSALLTPNKKDEAASWGTQSPLIVWSAPAGAEATVGKPLAGQTLAVDGAYVCLIPMWGLASTCSVHVRATLTTATCSSAGPDLLSSFDPVNAAPSTAVVLVAGTGDGALTTNTLQTASVSVNGARYAVYTLTVASAGTAAFTVAEFTGL